VSAFVEVQVYGDGYTQTITGMQDGLSELFEERGEVCVRLTIRNAKINTIKDGGQD
jgi:hypothetical protein